MAVITLDPVPVTSSNSIWIMIAAGIVILILGIKAWKQKRRAWRFKKWEENRFKA